MFRFFLGCLSVAAIGLVIGQAIAGGNNPHTNNSDANANNGGGVVIIETISASSSVQPSANNNDMEPLPNNPGVEVAPIENSGSSQVVPVMVEEGMIIQQTSD